MSNGERSCRLDMTAFCVLKYSWRHSECLPDLHQYVHDEDPKKGKEQDTVKKGPKVINLDDPPKPAP